MRDYCGDSFVSWVFFAIGLIATISMRVIEPLNIIDPIYGKISWYIGVTGFFIFFQYKFISYKKRSDLVMKEDLISKIRSKGNFEDRDYSTLNEILCSITSKKDRMNFIFIAVLSILALLLVVFFDLMKLLV